MATHRVAPSLWAALAATVSAGGLVMMAEIDRLVASSSSPAYPSAALYGPFHLFATDQRVLTAWNGAVSGDVPALATWLHEQLVADLLFLAGYTALLLVIDRRFRLRLTGLVVAVGFADLLEDVVAWFVFEPTAHGATDLHVTGPLVCALAVVTQAKWLAWLVLLIGLVFRLWQRYVAGQAPAGATGLPPADRVRAARRAAREAMHALFHQRFSLIVVGLLALMTVVPSGGVLDQAPDIIRRLLPAGGSPPDWVRLVATAIGAAGLCAALVYLGAVRAYGVLDESASATPTADPIDQRVPSTGVWWLGGAGLGAAVLGVLMAVGLVAPDPWAFGLPVAALVIGVASLVLRWRGVPAVPLRPRPAGPQTFARTRHIGRLLAYSVPVVVLLAAARAVTPVLALDGGPGLALVLLPLAGASAVWLVLAAVLKRSGPLGRESGSSSPLHPRVAGRTDTGSPGLLRGGRGKSAILLTAVAFAVISALLVVLPLWYGSAVGLLAVMMTSFTGLAALFATISIWIQRVAPPRLFQVMALRRTPAVTLLVLVAIITNLFAVSSPHDVRTPSAAANTAALGRWRSTTWEAAVANWLGGTTGPDTAPGGRTCTPPRTSVDDAGPHATGPITVRPMVFLALEGGGMRAAYWAADFLKGVLANRCLADDVVAVSSVSGGSVGLATVEALGDGTLGAVRRMAGQDGLSATVGALLTRDLLAGS
ncbi:MAG: hypothetical protein QOE37_1005, partial [Microbacteriaceae bacterium]|nr:hypothetical protein [Microbacteriaceae bacterium]